MPLKEAEALQRTPRDGKLNVKDQMFSKLYNYIKTAEV